MMGIFFIFISSRNTPISSANFPRGGVAHCPARSRAANGPKVLLVFTLAERPRRVIFSRISPGLNLLARHNCFNG